MFLFPPNAQSAERGFSLVDALRLRVGRRYRTDGNECGAGMIFAQAVFQAVMAMTGWARHSDGVEGVYIRSAGRVRALGARQQRWLSPISCRASRGGREIGSFPPRGGPFAGMRAFVGGFGAMVETVGAAAGLAAEGQKVELVAISVLAVGTDVFNVLLHGGVGGGVGRRRVR